MPEQQENQNLPAVADGQKKSGMLKWILIGVGSLVISYAISLIWIIYVEKPQDNIPGDNEMVAQDSTIVAEQPADTSSLAAEKSPADTISEANVIGGEEVVKSESEPSQEMTSNVTDSEAVQDYVSSQMHQNAMKTIPDEEAVNQQDFKKLAKIYSQMDSKAAAQILGRMNDDVVVGILNEMRDRNAAELLTAFSSVRAARLSQELSKLGT